MVICDDRHLPVGLCLPLTGYHAPARRMTAQANASKPTLKRLWQQIVRAKVAHQAALLRDLRGSDFGLGELAVSVRSGDPDNVEAQAARLYWPALFDSADFLRDPALPDQNRYLNYGYAILRAIVARAICASGLHPGLGIHHHHRNNAYCLADDLMEPFRPAVDRAAVELWRDAGPDAPLDRTIKPRLLALVEDRFDLAGERRTLFDCVARLCASVGAAFEGVGDAAALPDFNDSP